ncbi:LuxR C-terminal-related transcriptional regulator [Paludifilum halophilum]|uniref:HTH luxR-type domain-containing protein n=1 Tax=Paludifilum halophilum TaxID=1642702 RepID=A0A235B425_9BACL|nr:LuxR C-terminal-related transcriptional regulator [Paludifilum halophilum]OYD06981.1 hypothetical protein CHM34_13680 [Paludifilum halophilum]
MRISTFLSTPLLPQHELQQMMDTIIRNYEDCLRSWKIRLSTFNLDPEQKKAIHDLFQFLAGRIDLASSYFSEYEENFLQLVASHRSVLHVGQVLLTIGTFEEIVMGVLLQKHRQPDIHTRYRWLHSLSLTLACSVTRSAYTDPSESEQEQAPLKELKNVDPLLQTIIRLDEVLMTSHTLEELLTASVRFITERSGMERGALFWYSPLTRTIEGIYSHQVDVSDIRRVREMDSNIPGIAKAMNGDRTVFFFREAQLYFPMHYVKQFGLTSLLTATLRDENRTPVGFLLLDQSGKPFDPDAQTLEGVKKMVSRVCLSLRSKLYESGNPSPAPVSLLTQREQEILQMIADGHSTKHIGETLHISEHTAAEYAHSVLKKLKVKNRPEAVSKGLKQGLIR